jgi:hypothetical protein
MNIVGRTSGDVKVKKTYRNMARVEKTSGNECSQQNI